MDKVRKPGNSVAEVCFKYGFMVSYLSNFATLAYGRVDRVHLSSFFYAKRYGIVKT
jgi:hypothetical protein